MSLPYCYVGIWLLGELQLDVLGFSHRNLLKLLLEFHDLNL